MYPHPSRTASLLPPGRQRGAILIILLVLLATAFAAVLLEGLTPRPPSIFADPVDSQTRIVMDDAKASLTVWARTRDPVRAASPGLLPYPDRNSDGIYNGSSNCPLLNGNPVQLNATNLRLGMIPIAEPGTGICKTMGANNNTLMNGLIDSSGANLWMAVSQNLTDDNIANGLVAAVSTELLNPAHPTAAPRWLSVCDEQGRLLTNRAAFVVMAPLQALTGQNRGAAAPGAGQFLEQMTIAGTAPCNGLIRNNQNNLVYLSLQGASTATVNDRLSFVTAEQHLGTAAKIVANDIATQVRATGTLPADEPALSAVPGMPAYLVGPNYLANPAGWFVAMTYTRVSATQATISFANCAIVFTIQTTAWPNGNGLTQNVTNC